MDYKGKVIELNRAIDVILFDFPFRCRIIQSESIGIILDIKEITKFEEKIPYIKFICLFGCKKVVFNIEKKFYTLLF